MQDTHRNRLAGIGSAGHRLVHSGAARRGKAWPALLAVTVLLAGCGGAESGAAGAPEGNPESPGAHGQDHSEHDHGDHDHGEEGEGAAQETAGPEARLVATYDGGILTLDAENLNILADEPLEGFNRLNPVGDGRHVMVSMAEGFQLLDVGVWSEPHGDHSHSYATAPTLTDTVYAAEEPGHVVHHGETTTLFGDGDGRVQILPTGDFAEGAPEPTVVELEEPHHGVAVQLEGGELLHTIGNEDERNGVMVRGPEGQEIARNEQCPGVHGEAAAQGGVIAVGCEDGILYYVDGAFTKVDSPDEYGRIGNQAGSDESPVVLGDYKVDPDAELERPEQVSLTNTETGELQLVDLGTSYSFRSLARGPQGEALVLGTDGKLHVIDPASGEVTASHQVTEEWQEPVEWQDPRPTLFVEGEHAYVTEPSTNSLHMVELASGEVLQTAQLPHPANELTGVTG